VLTQFDLTDKARPSDRVGDEELEVGALPNVDHQGADGPGVRSFEGGRTRGLARSNAGLNF